MTEEIIKEDVEQIAEIDNSDEAETQIYEVGFHILPSVKEDNIAAEVDIIKSLINENGGVLIIEEFPKLIGLAYTITKYIDAKRYKFDTAYFGWIKFEINTDSIINIKEGMDVNENVLRYLIIKTTKESTIAPDTTVSVKTGVAKSVKSRTNLKTNQETEDIDKVTVSDEELDKTIEELVVE